VPTPNKGEKTQDFVHRYMGSGEAQKSFPKQKQRLAVAFSIAKQKNLANALRKK